MAIGDPSLNAGIGVYNPNIKGITTPGVSTLDEINKRRALRGMPPIQSGGLASPQTIPGQTVDIGKKTGAYYDMLPGLAEKIADLASPPSPQVSALSKFLVDDPLLADKQFSATIGQFKPPDIFDIEGGGGLGGSNEDQSLVFSEKEPNLSVDIRAAGLGVESPASTEKSTTSTATTEGADSGEEAGGLGEANADQSLVFSGTSKDDKKETTNPYEQALADAMQSVEESFSGEPIAIKSLSRSTEYPRFSLDIVPKNGSLISSHSPEESLKLKIFTDPASFSPFNKS